LRTRLRPWPGACASLNFLRLSAISTNAWVRIALSSASKEDLLYDEAAGLEALRVPGVADHPGDVLEGLRAKLEEPGAALFPELGDALALRLDPSLHLRRVHEPADPLPAPPVAAGDPGDGVARGDFAGDQVLQVFGGHDRLPCPSADALSAPLPYH